MHLPELIILDRDGVLNEDAGYVFRPEEWRFCPGVLESLAALRSRGVRFAIASNQSGVARGYGTPEDVALLMDWVDRIARAHAVVFDDIAICPFHPEGRVPAYAQDSSDRKPAPGMVRKILENLQVSADKTLLIGDSERDTAAALGAGVRAVLASPCEAAAVLRTMGGQQTE